MSKGARLPEGPPYVGLLKEDEAFLRWYLNVRRGSENTAAGYLRKMGNICAEHGINPKDLAKLSPVELNTFIGGLISAREEAGQRGSAIKSYVKALKSWLRFNAIKLELEPKLREDTPKYVDEKVFTRQQLASVLDHAGIREKVSISLIGFGGVRPATIGDATGTDGLKVHDFPELRIDAEKRKVEFEKNYTMDLSLDAAATLAIECIYLVSEDKTGTAHIKVAVVDAVSKKMRRLTEEEVGKNAASARTKSDKPSAKSS